MRAFPLIKKFKSTSAATHSRNSWLLTYSVALVEWWRSGRRGRYRAKSQLSEGEPRPLPLALPLPLLLLLPLLEVERERERCLGSCGWGCWCFLRFMRSSCSAGISMVDMYLSNEASLDKGICFLGVPRVNGFVNFGHGPWWYRGYFYKKSGKNYFQKKKF